MKKKGFLLFAFFTSILVALSFLGCAQKKQVELSDGTFTGRGAGRNGPIVVEITVKSGKVSDARIIEQQETEDIGFPIEQEFIDSKINTMI